MISIGILWMDRYADLIAFKRNQPQCHSEHNPDSQSHDQGRSIEKLPSMVIHVQTRHA